MPARQPELEFVLELKNAAMTDRTTALKISIVGLPGIMDCRSNFVVGVSVGCDTCLSQLCVVIYTAVGKAAVLLAAAQLTTPNELAVYAPARAVTDIYIFFSPGQNYHEFRVMVPDNGC